jgi:uncharacterized protein
MQISEPHNQRKKKGKVLMSIEKRLLAVIHAESVGQAHTNAEIARENGADGIFLINHNIEPEELLEIYKELRAEDEFNPGMFWIGLNFLGVQPDDVIKAVNYRARRADAVWVDNAGLNMREDNPTWELYRLRCLLERNPWKGMYFGGVAFKGQGLSKDPAKEAELAAPFLDVVTTSGPMTGYPPEVAKIEAMKKAIGEKPLAIASGISINNVHKFLPFADYFLMASNISKTFFQLDPEKVRELAQAIHAYKPT